MSVDFTEVEIDHLLTLLRDAESEGSYYGRRDHYLKRHERIRAKLLLAAAPPPVDPQPDSSRQTSLRDAIIELRELFDTQPSGVDLFESHLDAVIAAALRGATKASEQPDVQQLVRDHSVALEFVRALAAWDGGPAADILTLSERARKWLHTEAGHPPTEAQKDDAAR